MGFCFSDLKSSCIAFHEHVNYIFMHYRCVLYMLNCCVLLGLDWAEPMILFMSHITCSCIFMHTYLHFSIFLYWFVWCFSACLSLSLSLSCVSLLYGTEMQIYSVPKPSSFWGIFFFWPYSFFYSAPWWEGP